MSYVMKQLKVAVPLVLLLLIIGLAFVGNLRAQLKKDEVDFEYIATVTAQKGIDCCLWNMAEKHYGDPFQWTCIKEMNKIPNERRISVGTVIYIPAKCGRKVEAKPAEVEKLKTDLSNCEKALKDCQAEKNELAKALEECKKSKPGEPGASAEALKKCQTERERLAKALEECRKAKPAGASAEALDKCMAENKRLRGEMEECDARLGRLTRAVKDKDATIDELEAQVRKMKAVARECEEELDMARAKIRKAAALEAELAECRAALEKAKGAGMMKEMPCMKMMKEMKEMQREKGEKEDEEEAHEKPMKPKMPEKKQCGSNRSLVAAAAIALVGSIIWIASGD